MPQAAKLKRALLLLLYAAVILPAAQIIKLTTRSTGRKSNCQVLRTGPPEFNSKRA